MSIETDSGNSGTVTTHGDSLHYVITAKTLELSGLSIKQVYNDFTEAPFSVLVIDEVGNRLTCT